MKDVTAQSVDGPQRAKLSQRAQLSQRAKLSPGHANGQVGSASRPDRVERRLLLEQWAVLEREWYGTHCELVKRLADAFDGESVLDLVEKTWWDLGYEAGLAWREKFERDPYATMLEKARSWHEDPVFARGCCSAVPVLERDRWELVVFRCHKEVFLELGSPEIGLAWCMRDFATVQGWSPHVMMRQPTHLLRGDGYCHQIRRIVDDPGLQWSYSKETSRKVGWRSLSAADEDERVSTLDGVPGGEPAWQPGRTAGTGSPVGGLERPEGLAGAVEVPMQPAVFGPLPSRRRLQALVDEERRHNADVTSYMWHVIPVAEQFGESVYDAAADALAGRGLPVTAAGLRHLGGELRTTAGLQRYATERRLHVMHHTTG